jgi:SAM-dependent methyltransferase
MLQLVKIAPDPSTDTFHLWPVPVPPGTNASTLDQRCQIWRYQPETGQWAMVFESPRVEGTDGPVWRDFGYRTMVVARTGCDDADALYVTTMSSSKAPGALILRSTDGASFHPVTDRGLGDPTVSSFRAFVTFRDRLFVSPAGQGRLWAIAGSPVVLESRNPLARDWRQASPLGFGDPDNLGIFEMCVFDDHIYAGVGNARTGLQIWKTAADGEPPYEWTKVIDGGAGRGPLNQAVMSMCPFNGALYVGTGIRRGGYDRELKIGPAAGELVRIFPDDTWELVAGDSRDTLQGYKRALSGHGPGFNNPFAGYIWVMAEHDGHLYLGTYDSSVFISFVDLGRVPRDRHPWIRRAGVDAVVEREGGFDLWRSRDGAHWLDVTKTGFGNAYNYGVRTLAGTPAGLFLGAANPFGPEVAVKTAVGWQYVSNPEGGLQIWLGQSTTDAEGESQPAMADVSASNGTPPATAMTVNPITRQYDVQMYNHPLLTLSGEYLDGSNFFNYGYWRGDTTSHREACENLVRMLLDMTGGRYEPVLDVACGLGGTTRYLLTQYPAGTVSGINISDKQIATCRAFAPGAAFHAMDATDLEFDDATFGTVVCVEAAFHFRTRERFLREAYRVLRPGGWLTLSDMLYTRWSTEMSPVLHPANYVPDVAAYRAVLESVGFEEIQVVDTTQDSYVRSLEHLLDFLRLKHDEGALDAQAYRTMLAGRLVSVAATQYYVVAAARRPLDGRPARAVVDGPVPKARLALEPLELQLSLALAARGAARRVFQSATTGMRELRRQRRRGGQPMRSIADRLNELGLSIPLLEDYLADVVEDEPGPAAPPSDVETT